MKHRRLPRSAALILLSLLLAPWLLAQDSPRGPQDPPPPEEPLVFDIVRAAFEISPELLEKVKDRLYGIAYSFLGPIFFISLGFHITLDVLTGPGLWFLLSLTAAVAIGQVLSAGGMARLVGFSRVEALTVGVGMCGRAGLEFVLSSLGLKLGVIDAETFSVLIFTAFLLSLISPVGLKGCAVLLRRDEGSAAGANPP